jgi:lipopolysaccharide assembly outer membrane protein LptD (OstA)
MRKILLTVGLVLSSLGMYTYAVPGVSPSVQADFSQTLTDGSLRLTGNVVIVVNGIRITTDSGVYYPDSNVIEITGGNAHIALPSSPTIQKPR